MLKLKNPVFDIGLPFLGGGVVILLSFYGLGWITPTNTARNNVEAARIDERASVCQQAAIAHLAEVGDIRVLNETGVLAREMRDALAEEFVLESGDAVKDRLVREACSSKLGA